MPKYEQFIPSLLMGGISEWKHVRFTMCVQMVKTFNMISVYLKERNRNKCYLFCFVLCVVGFSRAGFWIVSITKIEYKPMKCDP